MTKLEKLKEENEKLKQVLMEAKVIIKRELTNKNGFEKCWASMYMKCETHNGSHGVMAYPTWYDEKCPHCEVEKFLKDNQEILEEV